MNTKKNDTYVSIADFLFEIGTMRKIARSHRQTLLTDDLSDNIASHSFRVTVIGYLIAVGEKLDPFKVVMMCLTHDIGETRSGDQNWIHRRYVFVDEETISKDQFTGPLRGLRKFVAEFNQRKSPEAMAAKDADTLDQLIAQKEYAHTGNREAAIWLEGKRVKIKYKKVAELKTATAKKIGVAIYDRGVSEWWKYVWTNEPRRKPHA